MGVGSSSKKFVKKQIKKKVTKKVVAAVGSKVLIPILAIIIIAFIGMMLLTLMLGQEQDVREHNVSEYSVNGGQVQNPLTEYATNEVPKEFEETYKKIGDKYNIDWQLLAAIHRVETAFSSNNTISSAGAIGHTQFMKCTWLGWSYSGCKGTLGNADVPNDVLTNVDKVAEYGGEGVDGNDNGTADPMELSDALSATAKKLEKDGANTDVESAVYNYNRDNSYVSDVIEHYNAYKQDVKFVTAGIDDITNLGKGQTGKGLVVGDMALPLSAEQFMNNMNGGIGSYSGHPGYDFIVPMGTPVFALVDGVVVESVSNRPNHPVGMSLAQALASDDLGNYIRIKPDNSPELMVNYMHLNTKENGGNLVKEGDRVEKGQHIGAVGNSGKTTAPHLHLDVLKNNDYSISSAVRWYEDLLNNYKANKSDD